MDEPLGAAAGNALEVAEAVDALQGRGPADLVSLTLDLAERVSNSPRPDLARWLEDGTAWRKWVALVEAQGGDATTLERMTSLHRAPIQQQIRAEKSGRITRMDAGLIGRACVLLGAGRGRATDAIDPAVGVADLRKCGEEISAGEPLLTIHARSVETLTPALALIEQAIEVSSGDKAD
jgi:thymidine phosphorylase